MQQDAAMLDDADLVQQIKDIKKPLRRELYLEELNDLYIKSYRLVGKLCFLMYGNDALISPEAQNYVFYHRSGMFEVRSGLLTIYGTKGEKLKSASAEGETQQPAKVLQCSRDVLKKAVQEAADTCAATAKTKPSEVKAHQEALAALKIDEIPQEAIRGTLLDIQNHHRACLGLGGLDGHKPEDLTALDAHYNKDFVAGLDKCHKGDFGGLSIWVIGGIVAAVLLLVGFLVWFFVLRGRKDKNRDMAQA